jgi:glycosyltransferase involved in cell wall biosynthesis
LKGVDLLAEAFRQTARTNPDARLIVVGNGELEKFVRSVLAEELIRGVVHIEPDVAHEELAHWYRAMDVLVMPSRYENFSNSILEAMACGISFLASDVGGNRMLAETGGGCTFEAGSVRSLVTGLAGILADGEEAGRRGIKGAEHVRGRYSWRATSCRLEQIISSQIGRNG